jgi:hypothetical protein
MLSFDYIAEAYAIRDALTDEYLARWRSRITDAIEAGATGTEILMALRWNLGQLLEAQPELPSVVAMRIRRFIVAANTILS